MLTPLPDTPENFLIIGPYLTIDKKKNEEGRRRRGKRSLRERGGGNQVLWSNLSADELRALIPNILCLIFSTSFGVQIHFLRLGIKLGVHSSREYGIGSVD
jgi:hypothetical protein